MNLLALDGVVTRSGFGPLSVTVIGGGRETLPEGVVNVAIGLEAPRAGSVALLGVAVGSLDAEGARRLRTEVAVIARDPVLLGHLDVRENVALPLRYHRRLRERVIDDLVRRALEEHGLGALVAARPHALTANQRRMVARVRALLFAPKVLFVVNDSSALDAQLCDDVLGRGGAVVHLRAGTA